MKLISSLDALAQLGRKPATEVMRRFYAEPDHAFDPALLRDPVARAQVFFIDSLVHGITLDPILNWTTVAPTPLGQSHNSPRRAYFLEWADIACKRLEWFAAHQATRPAQLVPPPVAGASLEQLSTGEIAQQLGLRTPPSCGRGPDARLSDDLWRRALIMMGRRAIPETVLGFHPPYLPLIYPCGEPQRRAWQARLDAIRDTEGIPLLVVEPSDFWRAADLGALQQRTAIFVFASANSLWHALAIPALFRLLVDESHAILIGGEYPDERLLGPLRGRDLPALVFAPLDPVHPAWSQRLEAMVEATALVVQRCRRNEPLESAESHWLYELGLNLKHEILARRFGEHAAPALRRVQDTERWFSPHKGRPPPDRPTHPPMDLLGSVIDDRVVRPARRLPGAGPRLRLAHVTSGVIDGGHAPSTLLRTLIERAARERWEVSVVSLESGIPRGAVYPRSLYSSDPSSKRAPRTIEGWRESGVSLHLCRTDGGADEAVNDAARVLSSTRADVAVFHGNDPLLLLCAAVCDVPRRVFFEHSGLVFQRDFDLAISPLSDAPERLAETSRATGVPVVSLPYCSNARATWEADPPKFRVGPEARILTTISNHLENRVTGAFVEAVATILQQCGNAIYAPIGHVADEAAFRARFARWGVQDRVVCVGNSPAPSQLCRGMHLYLNEFPFGSGIAITDAMAAGLPVVTMHDPKGPMQAQNGGNYIGIDRAIISLEPRDYITLACRLIQDEAMYREWSAHALQRFEAFSLNSAVEGGVSGG